MSYDSQERLREAHALSAARAEIATLRQLLTERAQMAHDLLIALAKRCLDDRNNECEPGEWPNGQSYDQLAQTSRDTLKRMAREEAGVDHAKYVNPLREGLVEVEEHD